MPSCSYKYVFVQKTEQYLNLLNAFSDLVYTPKMCMRLGLHLSSHQSSLKHSYLVGMGLTVHP